LTGLVREISWINLGHLDRIISQFKQWGISDAVMAGSIVKRNIFSDFRPDRKTESVLSRLENLHDDNILRALAAEFARQGIAIQPSTLLTPELLAPSGVLTRRPPSERERKDIEFGWKAAKAIGRLDIGQCIVVRDRMVLAVEALEGTDATIRRGGGLASGEAVVVKVSKPGQDFRFDLPAVGLSTVAVMSEVRASALAIEAGRTLMFDRADMVAAADNAGIAIMALEDV